MTNAHTSCSSSKNSPKKLVFLAGSYFYGNVYKSQLICSTYNSPLRVINVNQEIKVD